MKKTCGENGTGLTVGLAVALALAVVSVGSLGIVHDLLHGHSVQLWQSTGHSAPAQTVSALLTR